MSDHPPVGSPQSPADATPPTVNRFPVSIAPMMDYTDRRFRVFMRTITRHTVLYTEMITAAAIIHGDSHRLLAFDAVERPLVLQLGGDDPDQIARAVTIAEAYEYDEINLNVGCPSDRVTTGNFGAVLMLQPQRVAEIVAAARARTRKPVTVKQRIGVEPTRSAERLAYHRSTFGEQDFTALVDFVDRVADAGCRRFVVHARVAILQGLSPAANRVIPPLRYDVVTRLKHQRPHLAIEINGGIREWSVADQLLRQVDGVMIGRPAYEQPWLFADVDGHFRPAGPVGEPAPVTRRRVIDAMIPHIERWQQQGAHPRATLRHMLELFAGVPGARHWRRVLSSGFAADVDVRELVAGALARVDPAILDRPADPSAPAPDGGAC